MKYKNNYSQVYTPGTAMKLFTLGMGFFVAGMHLFVFRGADGNGITAFPALLLLFILFIDAWLLWYGLIFTTQTRVIVNEDGIELQRGGARLFATWEDMSHFGVKGAGKHQQNGIYLHHRVSPEVNGFAERIFYGRKTDFIPIGQVINLPRKGIFQNGIDLDKLAATEFGYDVSRFAPHLLEEEYDDKPKGISQRLGQRSLDATYVVGAGSHQLRKRS